MDYKGWTLNNRGLLRAGTGQIGEAVEDSTLNGSDRYALVPFIRNCTHSLLWQTRKEKGKKKKERQKKERKTPPHLLITYNTVGER